MSLDHHPKNRRILLVDDNKAIHGDICKVICPLVDSSELDDLAADMFGESNKSVQGIQYEIKSAYQGQEGLKYLEEGIEQDKPFALAFVDMRMPPGWDGIESIEHYWALDPRLQIVICTAYSDYSWEQITEKFGQTDKLLILKKPFDHAEVQQIACALTEKWNLAQQANLNFDKMEKMVEQRTRDIQRSNEKLLYEVTERKRIEEVNRHNATHDALTDLPNRALLYEQVDRCIARAKRNEDYIYAVLFIDLDNFKIVNDSLGHRTGDLLLIEMSHRLLSTLRTLDTLVRPGDDTAARLGGDEFVILLDGLKKQDDATAVAQRLLDSISHPFEIDGKELPAKMSIGIAVGQGNYSEPGEILRDADTALYQAKEAGKGKYSLFDSEMRVRSINRLQLETDLRKVIELQQLQLHYQPIVSLEDSGIRSFEALVRWEHPVRGLIAPMDFIPIAEECGIILDIGRWVIQEACSQLKKWQQAYPQYAEVSVSVNMSVKQLYEQDIVGQVDRILSQAGVEPKHVNLEMTESVIMDDIDSASKVLRKFKDRGYGIHMDDFGTGFSSLTYLHTLPIDAIKVDQYFIKNMSVDGVHAATIQAVITMAYNRGMSIIAEGVETIEQLVQLQTLDCGMAQGYYFAKPMTAQQLEMLLKNGGHWMKKAA